ncbi:MAG: hypothetical protein ACKV22_04020 [Bryobacteraceae bacterium]
MVRNLALFLCGSALASAAILPEYWAGTARGAVSKPTLTDRKVWDEYGLAESEQAVYTPFKLPPQPAGAPKPFTTDRTFTLTAWRLHDSTAAFAVFQWQTPPGAQIPDPARTLAHFPPAGLFAAVGNYLIRIDGLRPPPDELDQMADRFPRLEGGPPPVLASYLPAGSLVPSSRRYVIGPEGLAAFEPRISPSQAAFHLGSEAQFGNYQTPKGELRLGIFSYPTPQLARERIAELSRLPDVIVKRSGSLVALVLSPPDHDEAEKLLAKIRFQGQITWAERPPTRRDNVGDLIVNIFILIGILLGFSLVSGLAFGGIRSLLRFGRQAEDAMITLHLSDR